MYRRISEEKRKTAKAMLKSGKMVFEVARALDLSRATVYRMKHEDADEDEDVEALAGEIRKEIAGRYLLLADTILRGIDDTALDRASLRDKAIAAAIFTDKAAQLEKLKGGRGPGKCPMQKGPCPLETGLRQPGEGASPEEETKDAPVGAELETE